MAEIEAYLELQSNILKPSANEYGEDVQNNNKKIFFYLNNIKDTDTAKRAAAIKNLNSDALPSAMSTDLKLNTYKLAASYAQEILGFKINKEASTETQKTNKARTHLNGNKQKSFANKLNSTEDIFAALQFLSMTTNNKDAKKALFNPRFTRLSTDKISAATNEVAAVLPKDLASSDASDLTKVLLDKLETI